MTPTFRRLPLIVACLGLLAASAVTPARAQDAGTDVTVIGLESSLEKLGRLKGNRNAAQAQLFLNLFRGLAKQGAPQGGRTRLDYHFDIAENGHVIVNGQDLTALIELTQKLAPKG